MTTKLKVDREIKVCLLGKRSKSFQKMQPPDSVPSQTVAYHRVEWDNAASKARPKRGFIYGAVVLVAQTTLHSLVRCMFKINPN